MPITAPIWAEAIAHCASKMTTAVAAAAVQARAGPGRNAARRNMNADSSATRIAIQPACWPIARAMINQAMRAVTHPSNSSRGQSQCVVLADTGVGGIGYS